MDSKVTRYSAAAVVVLAVALVLFGPFGSSDNGSVVWAKVAENMDKVQMFVHKEQRFYYEVGKEEPLLEADVVKHACLKYGVVEQQYDKNGKLMHRAYVRTGPREIVGVLPDMKMYFKVPMSEAAAQLMSRLSPQGLVEYFMSKECTPLGKKRLDGHQVEGFETTDTTAWPIHDAFGYLFPVKQITWRFWVDVEDSLPVRAEYEIVTDRGLFTGFKKLRVLCKAYDFEFHQEVKDEVFDPNIPDDYTPIDPASTAKAGAALVGIGAAPVMVLACVRRRRRVRRRTGQAGT